VNWLRILILNSPAKRAGAKILQDLRNETEHNERITEQKLPTDIARLPAHDADARGSVPVSNIMDIGFRPLDFQSPVIE